MTVIAKMEDFQSPKQATKDQKEPRLPKFDIDIFFPSQITLRNNPHRRANKNWTTVI